MFRFLKKSLLMALLTAAATPSLASERLDKAALLAVAPHKALYSIEMTSKRSSSQVLNIYGQMYFALQATCEAWSTDHRFNLHYEYADSPPMQITSDFTTYEPLDGRSFDFNSRRKRDGELYQELRGTAVRDDKGLSTVTYAAPSDLTFTLPQGGFFPMAHTVATMKNIREGRKIFNAVVFDGSDEEGPIEVNTIIGKSIDVTGTLKPGPALDSSLLHSPARKVRMAFFPLGNDSAAADYEMDLILHDNGIISSMDVDYGEFSVSQKLVALEKIKPPVCGQKTLLKNETPAPPAPGSPKARPEQPRLIP